MSMLNRPANSNETGEVVASTRDYDKAQKTVSQLIAAEVPARDIAIVGQSVRTIERITGRLGYATAARSGAVNGLLIGLFLSAMLVFGNPEAPIQLFFGFVFIGVALGMLMSLITYAIVRRRRDFASITQFAADHYEVTVQPASLAKARQALGGVRPATVRPAVNLEEPPRYGERITPGAAQPDPAQPAAGEPGADEPAAGQPDDGGHAGPEGGEPSGLPGGPDAGQPGGPAGGEPHPGGEGAGKPAIGEPVIPPRPANPVPGAQPLDRDAPRDDA